MKNIERSGYKLPTPVQKYALPIILKGRDLMGCAQTGSGKTAAFLLPLLNNLLEQGFDTKSEELPQLPEAVIVAPTRELAIQIKGALNCLCYMFAVILVTPYSEFNNDCSNIISRSESKVRKQLAFKKCMYIWWYISHPSA